MLRSWNAAKDNGGTNAPTVTAEWNDSSDISTSGYTWNSPTALSNSVNPYSITTNILPTTVNNTTYGLYNPTGASDGNYWLASPSSRGGDHVCLVNYRGYLSSTNYYDAGNRVRPVVSIPISEVSVSGTTVSIK